MDRAPAVSGQFYAGTARELRDDVASLVDRNASRSEVIGVMAPHAGYVYSGAVAGAVFSRIEFKETFLIMGPNHTGMGAPFSIMSAGRWRTPLGDVEIDASLAGQLLAGSSYLAEDSAAHRHEHSIEVQLPFLQFFKPDVQIVPIVLAHARGAVYQEIGREIAGVIRGSGKGVVIVASSDMTHYESQQSARRKDTQAIEAILALDENELLRRVEELNITMCGYGPVVVLIAAAKELGAKSAELVRYQTSGDISGDNSSVVGYAGILIKG